MTSEQLTNDSKRAGYLAIVSRAGKFEGEPIYTPYYWEALMDGMADQTDDDADYFDVTDEDRELFPELAGAKRVAIHEDDNGFVYCERIW